MGFQWTFYQNELVDVHHFKNQIRESPSVLIMGIVTDKVEKEKQIRLRLAVNQIQEEQDSGRIVSGNLLVYLPKDSLTPPPQYGDLIAVKSKIQEIKPPMNPDAFNFKNYWHHQNIHYQSFVRRTEDVKILSANRGNPISHFALKAQAYFLQILKTHLKTEREYAVGSALLLGYRDAVTEDVRTAYIETGSMHILAVSGMHIVLIFNGLGWLLAFYRSGSRQWRWTKTGFLILLIWAFAVLTGLSASVVRAAMMSTLLAIAKAWSRRVNIYNVLAASAFLLLLANPYWLFDIGFQLSYLAVVGILFFYPRLRPLLPSFDLVLDKKKKLSPFTVWITAAKNSLPDALAIGLAAQFVVTPISLYYFHQFPSYFWLSSIFAVLVSTVALYAGILLFVCNGLSILASLIGSFFFWTIWILNEIVFGLQKLPLSILGGFWLPAWVVILIYGLYFLIAIALASRRLRLLYYPLSIATLLSVIYAFSEINKREQNQIIVYHIYRNSLVDIVCGKNVLALTHFISDDMAINKPLQMASENCRSRLKINNLEKSLFDVPVKNNFFILKNRVCQFGVFKMAILDRLPETPLDLPLNAVLLHANPRFSIEALQKKLQFDKLIFDGSNAVFQVEKWKEECHHLGIDYHDTAEKGAWILTLSDAN
jgi:competence protein ComEC